MRLRVHGAKSFAKRLGLSVAVFTLLATGFSSAAHGLGLHFWDDSDTDSNCDVRGDLGNIAECDNDAYNVALVATNTHAVPKGATTVHIVYQNIPTLTDASGNVTVNPNGYAFVNNRIHFDIQGDSWCPGYSGAAGINKKDSANGGYFASSTPPLPDTTKISTGTQVTNFEVTVNNGTGTRDLNQGVTNFNYDVGEYRNGSTYCDSSGASYTHKITVQPDWLLHQKGFPPDVWYVELTIVPRANVPGAPVNFYDPNVGLDSTQCAGGSLDKYCSGVSNKMRVILDTSDWAYTNGYYMEVSGSSISFNKITPGQDSFTMTYTNSQYDFDPSYQSLSSKHYTAVTRFGADCSVVNSPNGIKPDVHALLYDIDDSHNAGDQQKALFVEIRKDGSVYTLGSGGYAPDKSDAAGNWHGPQSGSWSQDYSDPDATRVDNLYGGAGTGSNKFVSINYDAHAGAKYLLYVYETRVDLVNQIGPTFDSVYFHTPCPPAAIRPQVSFVQSGNVAPGSTVNANAALNNTGNLDIPDVDWTRQVWYDADGDSKLDNGEVASGAYGQTDTGTGTYVNSNSIKGNGDPPFLTWNTTVPASPAAGGQMCTKLSINPSTINPSTTTISNNPPSSSNPTCVDIVSPAAYPYYSIRGGDIVAGPGIKTGTTCTEDPTADIIGHNVNGSPYNGSSSQLAALALDNIKAFSTANAQTGSYQTGSTTWADSIAGAPSPPSALAFSNDPSLISGNTYGGSLGINSGWCADDYYGTPSGTTVANSSGTGAFTQTAGTYNYVAGTGAGSTTTFTGGTIAANGETITLKVNGNLYINGPICYNTCAAAPPSLASIPSLQIIATGNIYIDPNVTRLDGFYASRGAVITCANGSGAITLSASLGVCNKQLVINGAVAAKEFIPNRNDGDVLNLKDTESPAEIIQYSPQVWLPSIGGGGSINQWDSVTSLPPIL